MKTGASKLSQAENEPAGKRPTGIRRKLWETPSELALYSLTERARSPFHAEPTGVLFISGAMFTAGYDTVQFPSAGLQRLSYLPVSKPDAEPPGYYRAECQLVRRK